MLLILYEVQGYVTSDDLAEVQEEMAEVCWKNVYIRHVSLGPLRCVNQSDSVLKLYMICGTKCPLLIHF
jgi:hypothetical protein